MKLSVAARDEVRRQLREHPKLTMHVASKTEVSKLSKEQLLVLAEKLNIDVESIVNGTAEKAKGMAAVLAPNDLERWEHTHHYPAFSGIYEFDMAFEMMGIRMERKARADYTHTPEWDYFDLNKGCVTSGWPGGSIALEVLTVPNPDAWTTSTDGRRRMERLKPVWNRIDLGEQTLSYDFWDALEDAIDAKCRAEDLERRRAHGVSEQTPALPPPKEGG